MKQDIKRIATRVFLAGIAVVLLYALAGFPGAVSAGYICRVMRRRSS
jgi:hypothetical protein